MSTLAFANRSLFGPLGSRATTWATDPQGYSIGGSELYLTPRAMAKVGYLYLRQGRWQDTQLIQEEYLEASTRTQVFPGDSVVVPDTYGYLWWVSKVGPYASYYAIGYGGQTIYVIPALDVVLVTTARLDVPAALGAGPRTFSLARDLAEQFVLRGDSLGAAPRSFQQQQHNRGCSQFPHVRPYHILLLALSFLHMS